MFGDDLTAPVVIIHTPLDYSEVTAPTPITITVDDEYLQDYTLTLNRIGDNCAEILASGHQNVTQTVVADFDPTLRKNGLYELELEARDVAGHTTRTRTVTETNRKGWIIRETSARGQITEYGYDQSGNEVSRATTRLDEFGQARTLTWLKSYDAKGQVTSETNPLGHVTRTEYDANGKVTATVDALGRRTTYEFDALGNAIRTVYPDGSSDATTYDANGNVLTQTDRSGLVTRFVYDTANRVTHTIAPDGSETRQEYDAAGRVVRQFDQAGNITSYEYDLAGRRTAVINALGQRMTSVYDALGNVMQQIDNLGRVTSFVYDDKNRRVQTVFDDGTSSSVVYNALDQKVSETDQAGVTTSFAYDEQGQLVSVTDALGQVTQYTYDRLGQKLEQIDAEGRVTSWTYDDLGRVTSRTLPLGMREFSSYDANGNMTLHTDFNGATTRYQYDILNRLVSTLYADGSQETVTYTINGQRETVTTSQGTTYYGYDLMDRLASQDNPDGTWITYDYDVLGNRIQLDTPHGTTSYSYDALSRLLNVTDAEGGTTWYGYNAVGSRASVTQANGVVTSYTYNELNRLTYQETRESGGVLLTSYQYSLGLSGNRLSVQDHTGRVVNYGYDTLYRLTQEQILDTALGNQTISYSYDQVGNRQTKTDASGTITYSYDANDRILTADGDSYQYDLNGNTPQAIEDGEVIDYGYDARNRLIEIWGPQGNTQYQYNADGIRVASIQDGEATRYLVDANQAYAQVLEERDASGYVTVAYTYGDDLISQTREGLSSYYAYDGHGSTTALTDSDEAVTDTYVYDAWGELLASTGETVNHYLYTGEQYDLNAGFYYLRARFYNPSLGRFHTMDTWMGRQFEPVTLHKYLYGNANPVMYSDPTGNLSLLEQVSVLTITTFALNSLTTAYSLHQITKGSTRRNSPLPDGIILSLGGTQGTRGFAGSIGADFVYEFKSGDLWAFGTAGLGVSPITLYKQFRSLGGNATAGFIWNMDSPKQLTGWGITATWPITMIGLLVRSLTQNKYPGDGFLRQLAKNNHNIRKSNFSVQFGFSVGANPPAFIKIGARSLNYSWDASYSLSKKVNDLSIRSLFPKSPSNDPQIIVDLLNQVN